MIFEFSVQGYRSLQDISISLDNLNIITGPNGSGKSSLYNALYLLAQSAGGNLSKTLSLEGGMPSILWAGARKATLTKKPVRMILSVRTDLFSYEMALGLPTSSLSLFGLDPQVKEEAVWHGKEKRKSSVYLDRKVSTTWIMNNQGNMHCYPLGLMQSESVLSQLHEPHLYPELSQLRAMMQNWRFYHHFRTDMESPLRRPQVGIQTPILSNSGIDLASALQTIIEIGDTQGLHETIEAAFPGSSLIIRSEHARFEVLLQQRAMKRPFEARELSDGTLKYLCLVAALLSPRPAAFLVLNEPETSLHPDLIEPLAHLIYKASSVSQVWVTTHSQRLTEYLSQLSKKTPIILNKSLGFSELILE